MQPLSGGWVGNQLKSKKLLAKLLMLLAACSKTI